MTDQNWIIDTVPSTRYPVYTRLYANDVMPDPITPLGASLVWIPEILPAWAVGNVNSLALPCSSAPITSSCWAALSFTNG